MTEDELDARIAELDRRIAESLILADAVEASSYVPTGDHWS